MSLVPFLRVHLGEAELLLERERTSVLELFQKLLESKTKTQKSVYLLYEATIENTFENVRRSAPDIAQWYSRSLFLLS
jgi:hypothetical protein